MSEEKIYLGNGTEKFNGDLVSFALNLGELKKAAEHVFEYKGTKYIKLAVHKKKSGADQYGKTHYVVVDTFKPDKTQVSKPAVPVMAHATDEFEDEIPF